MLLVEIGMCDRCGKTGITREIKRKDTDHFYALLFYCPNCYRQAANCGNCFYYDPIDGHCDFLPAHEYKNSPLLWCGQWKQKDLLEK